MHAFAPASFDLAFSRFGVMFFTDPTATFVNIRRALKPHGRLTLAAFRTPQENSWGTRSIFFIIHAFIRGRMSRMAATGGQYSGVDGNLPGQAAGSWYAERSAVMSMRVITRLGTYTRSRRGHPINKRGRRLTAAKLLCARSC